MKKMIMQSRMSSAFLLTISLLMTMVFSSEESFPERPINLVVTAERKGSMAIAQLKWKDQSNNEFGFEILRSTNGNDFSVVGSVGANTEQYRDEVGRYINGAFVYRVRAFNMKGKSEESNSASVWF